MPRIRKDVKNGDVVYKNSRGWWVPVLDDIMEDEEMVTSDLKVYVHGHLEDLTFPKYLKAREAVNEYSTMPLSTLTMVPESEEQKGLPVWAYLTVFLFGVIVASVVIIIRTLTL